MAKAKHRHPPNRKLKAKQRKQAAQQKNPPPQQGEDALVQTLTGALQIHVQGNSAKAEAIAKQLLQAHPDHPEVCSLLGVLAYQNGRMQEAIAYYQRAVAGNPNKAGHYSNLGAAFNKSGQPEKAVEAYEKAIALDATNEQFYFNMAIALRALGRVEEAITCYEKVLAINPEHASAHYNLGNALENLGKTEEAISHHQKTSQIDSSHAKARYNKALLNLRLGNLKEGFADYELRWLQDDAHAFPKGLEKTPVWDGRNLNGGTLLIYGEQGLGDVLQFIRYAPLVKKEKGVGKILVRCHPPLHELLKSQPAIDEILHPDASLPKFDAFVPIMSLPHVMATELATIPANVPYLFADPQYIEKWRSVLNQDGFKIGIVWKGAAGHKNDHNRSCTLAMFETLMDIPGTEFYSIQKGRGDDELAGALPRHKNLHDLSSKIENFSDTAAIIQLLDLVISVDTAPAHLTGALGKPVWTLLPFVPDWRWLMERGDCPWYPSMRLFRQNTVSDWTNVFQELSQSLYAMTGTSETRTQTLQSAATELNRAQQLYRENNYEAATALCNQLLEDNPNLVDAHSILGMIAHHREAYETAAMHHRKASELAPNVGQHFCNLGAALQEAKQLDAAEEALKKAIALEPENPDFLYNLSMTHCLMSERPGDTNALLQSSLDILQRIRNIKPDGIKILLALGKLLHDVGRYDESLQTYARVLELDPGNVEAIFNRSFALLVQGNLEEGFRDYEYRFKQKSLPSIPGFVKDKPCWDGKKNLQGKTILIYAEQGFGDVLQFIRYTKLLKGMGAKVIAECQKQLLPLLRQLPHVDGWLEPEKPLPYHDLHAPIMSLPHLLKTTLETIPQNVPYLFAYPEKVAEWKEKIPEAKKKIGFVWAGRPQHKNDHNRSCTLSQFESLMDMPDTVFISLQKGEGEDEAKALAKRRDNVIELGSQFSDFIDTAAVVAQLDLIISVDTSVVHLAGAMGKPTWVLLPHIPDFRWLNEREECPWYPTIRLFRQHERRCWEDVFLRIKEGLKHFKPTPASAEAFTCPTPANNTMIEDTLSAKQLQQAALRFQIGDLEQATKLCQQVLEAEEKNGDALNLFSLILIKQNRIDEALSYLRRATAATPKNAALWGNLGSLYLKLGATPDALVAYDKARQLAPAEAKYHYQFGHCAVELKQWNAAADALETSLHIQPDQVVAHGLMGSILQKSAQVEEAIAHYDKALALNPDDKKLSYNRALCHLTLGNYKEGFAGYEHRWGSIKDLALPSVARDKPRWDGKPLHGKTLFIHTEQGFGDAIQFIRFVHDAAKAGGKLIIGCKEAVLELFRSLKLEATYVPEGKPVPPFDVHIPAMSLPYTLGTSLQTLPNKVPYLYASTQLRERWKKRLNPKTFNIGLVWSGNPKFPDNANRSCPLSFFETLMDIPGITFYSLQKGSGETELAEMMSRHAQLHDFGADIHNFSDTAAILCELDLLISTDTSVPHLAGALGQKFWLLASYIPDWRWMLKGETSPWYPTARIFRQPAAYDWGNAMSEVKMALKEVLAHEA